MGKNIFRMPELPSESKFNMASLDMQRMDIGLKAIHDMIQQCEYDEDIRNRYYCLRKTFRALKNCFPIMKWAYRADDREKISKKLSNAKAALSTLMRYRITEGEYDVYLETLEDILDDIYRAKQEAGAGLPMQRKELADIEKISERV